MKTYIKSIVYAARHKQKGVDKLDTIWYNVLICCGLDSALCAQGFFSFGLLFVGRC